MYDCRQLENVCSTENVHNESTKGCKDQESIQSSTTPDPGYQWESDKPTEDTTNESQEASPPPPPPSRRPRSTHKQTRTKHSKHKTEQKHKRSTKEAPPRNGQQNTPLEGPNRSKGANLTPNSDVDQDT